MILVNANISSNSWTALSIDCPDITAIQITGAWGTRRFFNIYNDQKHSQNITALNRYLLTSESEQRSTGSSPPEDLWCGDFNRHSPMWDEARNSQLFTRPALREAQRLIDLAATWNMHMALRPGINTLESTSSKNYTRPDNVWVSDTIWENIIECDVLPSERPACTDHLPIITTLDISLSRSTPPPRYNWRKVVWEALTKDMKIELDKLPVPHVLRSIDEFKTSLKNFDDTLKRVMDKHVPLSKPSPYQKRWWSLALQKKRTEVRKLARKVYKLTQQHDFDNSIHEDHRKLRNEYTQMIRDTKTKHWIDWLEHADEQSIWTVHRFIASPSGDGAKTRIPNLKVKQPDGTICEVKENKDKAKALYDSFFFPPPAHDDIDPYFNYPPLAPPSKTSPTPKFTGPSSASNPTKAQAPTINPTPSTSTAVNSSYPTSAHIIAPRSISNTTPKHGKNQQPLYSANPTSPTTHLRKHTAPSPSSRQSPKPYPPLYPKTSFTSPKLTTSSLRTLSGEDQADPQLTPSC